jgi:hypothetical protein
MRYFKNTNGDVHGYDETYTNDAPYIETAIGAGWIEVTGNWPPPLTATEITQSNNAILKSQITQLEAAQARPLRELALSVAGALQRVQSLDSQIATLRSQLNNN